MSKNNQKFHYYKNFKTLSVTFWPVKNNKGWGNGTVNILMASYTTL